MENNEIPKYQRIKDYIMNLIEDKSLSVNDRIPSETELAKMIGYSVITVRHALSELVNEGIIYRIQGKGSFVAEPREKETGRNNIANRLVAFILSSHESYDGSFMQMIKGMQTYLRKNDYSLIIEYTDDNLNKEKEIIKKLVDGGVAGLIIFSFDPDACIDEIKMLKDKRVPFVMIDRYTGNVPVNYVVSDNSDGAFRAVQYLIEQGHRKIAYVGSKSYLSSEKERFEGYKKALNNSDIELSPEIIFNDEILQAGRLISLINKGEITAVLAVNDVVAIEIIGLCSEQGIKIPENVSVIGFDDIESAKLQKIPLSTVKQYFNKIGYEAAKILIHAINDPELGCSKIQLPVKVVIRETTSYNKVN